MSSADALLLVGDLDAVKRHVEVAAREQVEQLSHWPWTGRARTPSSRRERVGEVDLEADEVVRIHRILEDVGRAALRVGAPAELAGGTDAGERVVALGAARDPGGDDEDGARRKATSARRVGSVRRTRAPRPLGSPRAL